MPIGFIPITRGFDKHRFCEENHSFDDQWYNRDVYFWNLNRIKEGDELVATILSYENGTGYMDQPRGDNQDDYQAAGSGSRGSGAGGNLIENGWIFRAFHPKKDGHTVIKDAVIARMRADKVTGVV